MSAKEAIAVLREKFQDRILEAVDAPVPATKEKAGVLDPFVRVAPKDLVEVMTFCRDDARLGMDLLACLTAVDYPKDARFQLVYNLRSVRLRHDLTVKVDVPREDPRVPTLENVYRTADWHERESFDLMGIRFEGHHNLVRILCAEDWEGHPLRKDYVTPEYYHDIPNAFEMFYDVQNP